MEPQKQNALTIGIRALYRSLNAILVGSEATLKSELLPAPSPAGRDVGPLGPPLVRRRVAGLLYPSFPSALGSAGNDRVSTGPFPTVPVAAPPLSFFAAVRGPSARARGAPPPSL